MFEDQQNQQNGQVPGDLPTGGEPEDIFGGVETAPPTAPEPSGVSEAAPPPAPASPSALGAGALRPKTPPASPSQPMAPPVPGVPAEPVSVQPGQSPQPYQIKSPSIGRGVVSIVITVVVVAIIGGGGWWIYNSFVRSPEQFEGPATTMTGGFVEDFVAPEPEQEIPIAEPEEVLAPELEVSERVQDEEVLFGEPIDRDGDGLDDVTEQEIGTDPNNWDTDGDELADGDEVLIWKTDPLNPDTDGDTFLDGAEVKSGYSPVGSGRIFEAPTST